MRRLPISTAAASFFAICLPFYTLFERMTSNFRAGTPPVVILDNRLLSTYNDIMGDFYERRSDPARKRRFRGRVPRSGGIVDAEYKRNESRIPTESEAAHPMEAASSPAKEPGRGGLR